MPTAAAKRRSDHPPLNLGSEVATDEPAEAEALPPGTTAGRYVILTRLGEGGVGQVYAAWDPRLDRKVAIKVLRQADDGSAASTSGQARLLREAQAMARLKHPNVVPAYDVGTLLHAGRERVFLAMELVEGGTLRHWLREKHSRRQILEVFLAAGRGLAAAHAAGMIHRDFKPDNVLVGLDGRVLVTDFGLVRASNAVQTPSGPAPPPSPAALDTPMTHEGTVLGTPAYMAPEQHRAEPADEKSDQFSFCVALYEALTGRRPFGSADELRSAAEGGKPFVPPPREDVPPWLYRLLVRGMAERGPDRWPSMNELLAVLARDPARRWRSVQVVASVVGLLVIAAGVGYRLTVRERRLCQGAPDRLAAAWGPSMKDKVRRAFTAVGADGPILATTLAALDEYGGAWVAMHGDACEATRVRGEQPESVLALRMECLEARKNELGALTSLLAGADRELAEKAPEATTKLTPIRFCADVAALSATVPPPTQPSARRRVEELRGQLAKTKALLDAARYPPARVLVDEVLGDPVTRGYAPLEAEALQLRGKLLEQGGQMKPAEEALVGALDRAYAGHDDTRVAGAAIDLALFTSYWLTHHEEAHRWAHLADAAITRLGGSRELEADLRRAEAEIFVSQQKGPEAVGEAERALALAVQIWGAGVLHIGPFYGTLAASYLARGETEKARTNYVRQLELYRRLLGPAHPQLAMTLNDLGLVADAVDDNAEATERYRAALTVLEQSLGPRHPRVAIAAANLGYSLKAGKHFAQAMEMFHRALSIYEEKMGNDYSEMIDPIVGIGESLVALGRARAALPWLERGIRIGEKSEVPSMTLAEARFTLADALWQSGGDRARALALARAARAAYAADDTGLGKRALPEIDGWLKTRH